MIVIVCYMLLLNELLIHFSWKTQPLMCLSTLLESYQPKYNLHMVGYITHVWFVYMLKYDRTESTKKYIFLYYKTYLFK